MSLVFVLQQTMLGTILIAIVWALFGFTALMMTFAPNAHPTGDVTYIYLKYIRRYAAVLLVVSVRVPVRFMCLICD